MEIEQPLLMIDKIDQLMLDQIHHGCFSMEVFQTLDNVNTGRHEIEQIKAKISDDILNRLFKIANSVHFGTLRRGEIDNFYDVVNRLGIYQTKAIIIALTIYSHGKMDKEIETIFARCFATSVMAQMLATQLGFSEDAVKKAELGGLTLEMGRKVMLLYRRQYDRDAQEIDDAFIETYHPYLGQRIAERFHLPDYIKTMILARNVILEENFISLPGVVYLAYDTVRISFATYGNRLVLKFQTPRPATDVSRTLEALIKEKFSAAGLEDYLHIIRIPRIYDL